MATIEARAVADAETKQRRRRFSPGRIAAWAVMIAFLIGGSVVVEIVYAVPGLGALMIGSVLGRDYFVIQGLTLVYALVTVLVTLAIDILTAMIDPRTVE